MKYITVTALLAFSASATTAGAFTTPSTAFIPTSSVLAQKPRTFGSAPLQLLKFDMAKAEAESSLKLSDSPQDFDSGENELIAPTIYAIYTVALIRIIYGLRDAIVTTTLGSKALALVTGALIWDNLIITIGSFFFKDIDTNPTKYKILKILSYPRFTLHAVGTPLQCITIAEMGKYAGVGFLQSEAVQIAVIIASFVVAIADRTKFVNSPGIEQTITYEPFERDLTKFGYVEPEFAYVIPAIILCLFNLVVGIAAQQVGAEPEVAKWMIFAGATALIGNALPGNINTFTGNLGEVGMQYGLLNAARIVYGGM